LQRRRIWIDRAASASIANGQLGFWINGDAGLDYTIEASTNLTSWTPVNTISSPSLPYFWVDTNSASLSYPSLSIASSWGLE